MTSSGGAGSGAPPAAPAPRTRASERRRIWVAAGVVFGVLAVLLAIVIVTAPPRAGAPRRSSADQSDDRPRSIRLPGVGRAPQRPGDRGGWEQLATLATIVAAVLAVTTLAWWSGRRNRRGRLPSTTRSKSA